MKKQIELTPEAYTNWKNEWRKNENLLKPGNLLEDMRDWGGKVMGNTLRIAGLIHAMRFPTTYLERPVDNQSVLAAMEIKNYLIPHAIAAYALSSQNRDIQMTKRIFNWIKENRLSTFTKNECHKRFKNSLHKVSDLNKILKILSERNYIRRVKDHSNTVGRPSVIFEVNPKVFL